MNHKRLFLFIAGWVLLEISMFAQGEQYPYRMVFFESTWEKMVNTEKKKFEAKKLEGSQVLNEDFLESKILLHGDTTLYKKIPVRVNFYENSLEVMHKAEIKYLPSTRIEQFELSGIQGRFVTHNMLSDGLPQGFYKILHDDEVQLLCHFSYDIKPANYNVQMDVGNENDEIIPKEEYYMEVEGEWMKLEDKRRRFMKQFDEKEIVNYIKENKIDPGEENELLKFILYYESVI